MKLLPLIRTGFDTFAYIYIYNDMLFKNVFCFLFLQMMKFDNVVFIHNYGFCECVYANTGRPSQSYLLVGYYVITHTVCINVED